MLRAIVDIGAAIDRGPIYTDTPVEKWLTQVGVAVSAAHQEFRLYQNDPDGYGSATFPQYPQRILEVRG